MMYLAWYNTGVNMPHRILVSVAFAAALISSAVATSVVGTWHGKVIVNRAALPKAANPQQQAQMNAGLAQASAMKITLTLNANHTYKAVAVAKTSQTDTGTWAQKGNQITLTPSKNSKQASQKALTLSGNKMSVTVGPFATVVFTK